MLEIIIDNRDGNLWDISNISSDVTYKTSRIGKASSFGCTFITGGIYENTGFKYGCGDIIRVHMDGKPIFYGYIFTIEGGREEDVKITAYDQLRYLTGKDSYYFKNVTLGEIIKQIANATNLKLGSIEDTGHKIPKQLEDEVVHLDMINNAIQNTRVGTFKTYVFYDNFGELTLRDAEKFLVDLVIGDNSLLFDYKQKRSIDSDTYNQVRLVQDNKKTGIRDAYQYKDSANIKAWGLLQYFQKVDEKMNVALINQKAKSILLLKNREQRSFNIDAIGDSRVRAGCRLYVDIKDAGIKDYFVVNECTHKFEGVDHTMSLELQVYG